MKNNVTFQIKGATSVLDYSGLKLDWVKTISQLNLVEAENILKAYSKYFSRSLNNKNKWFTLAFLKKVHLEMFGNIWDWAGIFRKTFTNIGTKPHLITSEVALLCEDVKYWTENASFNFLEQSIRIHHRLVKIHAFINGNGRHARFVADLFLHSKKGKLPQWPTDLEKEGKNRKAYIASLQEADKGSYNLLYDFILSCGGKNKH